MIRNPKTGWLSTGRIIWPVLVAGVVYPLLVIGFVSTCQPLDFGGVDWHAHSMGAYVRLLFEKDFDGQWVWQVGYASVFIRSIGLATAATALCVGMGLPTALWLACLRDRSQKVGVFLLVVPFLVSVVVRSYGWMTLLADHGVLNRWLAVLGMKGELGLLYTNWATLLGLANVFTPFMVLPIYAAIHRFDWDTVNAARSLGASEWDVLKRIVIPDLLGGAKSMMVGNLIQLAFGPNRDWPKGAALGKR